MYKLCIDASAAHKKLGLELLASLSLEVGQEAIVPLLEPLQPVFSEALNAPNPTAVRVACLKAVASTVPHVVDKEHRAKQQAMQAHLPACFAILNESLAAGDMANARECLSSFIDITSSDAAFLRPHVDTLLSTAFAVAGGNVDENVRHLGLELMVTFAECKPVCRSPSPPSLATPSFPFYLFTCARPPRWLGAPQVIAVRDDTGVGTQGAPLRGDSLARHVFDGPVH